MKIDDFPSVGAVLGADDSEGLAVERLIGAGDPLTPPDVARWHSARSAKMTATTRILSIRLLCF
jgi:hypothetical protein